MRFAVTKIFSDWLTTNNPRIGRVALVGGTSRDPEIAFLKAIYPAVEIDTFGIENPFEDLRFFELDLNQKFKLAAEEYDLVLCSQVLEHVWNLGNAFDNLRQLVKPNGYIWINCPASNMAHGSPAYYSAGFSSGFLSNNLEIRNFEVLMKSDLGSKRYYFMTHILRQWVSEQEHSHPIMKYVFQPGSKLGVIRKYIREFPGRVVSVSFSKKIENEITFATEALVLARLKDQ